MAASTPVLIARAAGSLSRRLGRGGGTSLPGKLLLRLRPEALGELAAGLGHGALAISATNGKTTTARLVSGCARAAGWRVVANQSGANLLSGVATALLEDGREGAGGDVGVFEVDEAALPAVAAEVRPRAILLMNLFRDQLDRYGELEELATRWREMLAAAPPGCRVVLNADDPAVAALGLGLGEGVAYFGIEDPGPALADLPHAADSRRCRRCAAPLAYDVVYLGHMGHWRCPECGLARPRPEVAATRVVLDGVRGIDITIATPGGDVAARLPLPGLHNAYNATAAVAGALALGVPQAAIEPALRASQAAFGRAERVRLGGREVVLLLVKNPAGANETIRTLLLDEGPLHVLAALNDRAADGRDVSWIWDVDYEPLFPRLAAATLSGDRAYDLALRFRYGGVDPGIVRVVPPLERALDAALAATPPDRPLYLLPTYTAMLELRRIIVDRGAADAFWRDG